MIVALVTKSQDFPKVTARVGMKSIELGRWACPLAAAHATVRPARQPGPGETALDTRAWPRGQGGAKPRGLRCPGWPSKAMGGRSFRTGA